MELKMEFAKCCHSPCIVSFDIHHASLSKDIKAELASLLWYLPEIDSYQAMHESVFINPTYDDYLFGEFERLAGFSNQDVLYESNDKILERSVAEYYANAVCLACQKILFVKGKKTNTKIASLFKNLRDTIAHGCFNLVGNYFVGFNHPKYKGVEYTAVFKAPFKNLLSAVKEVSKLNSPNRIFGFALGNQGYTLCPINETNSDAITVSKGGFSFQLDFRPFKGRYIDQLDIAAYVNEKRLAHRPGLVFVLIADSTYTNSTINEFVAGEHIVILDRNYVKEMLSGEDVLMKIAESCC